ncbi:MAG: glycosyltransferase, partial [Ruthenibacterium sp.]
TKVGLRIATFGGFFIAGVSFLVALVYLVMKLVFWQRFVAGFAPMLIVSALLGGVQLFFIGLVGEYILNMNARIIDRPLVIEERRINFDDNAPQIDR